MATPTPEAAAQAWSQGLQSKVERMKAGVQAVTVSPGQAAARQKSVWAQNVAAAQDKWARNTAAVSLTAWQEAFVNKGLPRIASGAAAGESKMAAFMGQFLPYVSNAVKQLPPRGTFEQNLARSAAMIRASHAFNYQRPQ